MGWSPLNQWSHQRDRQRVARQGSYRAPIVFLECFSRVVQRPKCFSRVVQRAQVLEGLFIVLVGLFTVSVGLECVCLQCVCL